MAAAGQSLQQHLPTAALALGNSPTEDDGSVVLASQRSTDMDVDNECGAGGVEMDNLSTYYHLDDEQLARPCSAIAAAPAAGAPAAGYEQECGTLPPTLLGKGTYGVVLRYQHRATRTVVAVKTIDIDRLASTQRPRPQSLVRGPPVVSEYQLLEMVCAMSLPHPHLLQAIDVFQEPRRTHLVFPLAETPLRLWPFTAARRPAFMRIFHQVLCGLSFLHSRRLLHRDVKPDNILLWNVRADDDHTSATPTNPSTGQNVHARLGDWSMCRPQLAAKTGIGLTCTDAFTRWYRPVEALLGSEAYDGTADVWSLGVTMVHTFSQSTTEYFCQDTEDELLLDIFRQLGFPSERAWPGASRLPHFRKAERLVAQQLKSPLRFHVDTTFTQRLSARLGTHGIQLLLGMLALNPAARLTADNARAHRYFRGQDAAATTAAPLVRVDVSTASGTSCSPPACENLGRPFVCTNASPLPLSLVFELMQRSFNEYTVYSRPPMKSAAAAVRAIPLSEEVIPAVNPSIKVWTVWSAQQACAANGIALALVAEMWIAYTVRKPTPTEDRAKALLRAMLHTAWDWYFDWHSVDINALAKQIPLVGDLQRDVLETLAFDLVSLPTVFSVAAQQMLPAATAQGAPALQRLHVLLLMATYGRFLPCSSCVDIEKTVMVCEQVALLAADGDPNTTRSPHLATAYDKLRLDPDSRMLCATWQRGLLIAKLRMPELLFGADPALLTNVLRTLAVVHHDVSLRALTTATPYTTVSFRRRKMVDQDSVARRKFNRASGGTMTCVPYARPAAL